MVKVFVHTSIIRELMLLMFLRVGEKASRLLLFKSLISALMSFWRCHDNFLSFFKDWI